MENDNHLWYFLFMNYLIWVLTNMEDLYTILIVLYKTSPI